MNASDDLDKSESLVKNKFEKIRNTDLGCVNFTGQPCDSENLQVLNLLSSSLSEIKELLGWRTHFSCFISLDMKELC